MTIIEDSGGTERRPNAARVERGRIGITTSVDGSLETLVNRPTVHQQIHDGNFWSAVVFNSALGAGATANILIVTGDNPVHMRFTGASSQTIRSLLFEATTVSNNGTPVTIVARNRVNVQVPGTTIFSAPTITGDGTQLYADFIPGGNGPRSSGGLRSAFDEYILAPNTNYLARVVNNLVSGPAIVSVDMEFYET